MFGVAVGLKATLLLVVALVCHGLLGRRGTLIRSALWNACLVGLLLLPLAEAQTLRVRLLARPEVVVEPGGGAGEVPAPNLVLTANRPAPDAGTIATPRRDGWAMIVLGYVVVLGALTLRLGRSLRAIERLRRSGLPIKDSAWIEALDRWRDHLELRLDRPIRLVRSSEVTVPIMIGGFRPVILLPEALMTTASSQIRDAVLLHELTHLRRGDYGWNLVLQLVRVVYWPHPLVWLEGRLIASVREDACDGLCIHWLGGAAGYCATLLDVARGMVRRPWEALGLAMGRPTRLGRRIRRLKMSQGSPSCLLRRPIRRLITGGVATAFLVSGAVTVAQPQVRERQPEPPVSGPGAGSVPNPPRRVPVERITIVMEDASRTTSQPATLHPFEEVELYPKVAGFLKELKVDIGDRVQQGQFLAGIENTEILIEADRARAVVARSQNAVSVARLRVKAAESDAAPGQGTVREAEKVAERTASVLKFREKQIERYKALLAKRAVSQELLDQELEKRDEAAAAERSSAAAVLRETGRRVDESQGGAGQGGAGRG